MHTKTALALFFFAATLAGNISQAFATGREPASCVLYPYFNTNPGDLAVITVTNVGADPVDIRLVFIGPDNNCLPKDYWRTLSGFDTFSFVDKALNQKKETGFCYIYVVASYGSKSEKKADVLIGQEFIFSNWGDSLVNYGMNAVSFAVGDNTVNGDGKLRLDGLEYDPAPSELLFPRYFGQENQFQSKLILMNFTGGKYFKAILDFLVRNDSEYGFSSMVWIPCYWYGELLDMLPQLTEGWLDHSSTDFDELYDGTPPSADHKQTGWMKVKGVNAHYFLTNFEHPGIYGALIERAGTGFAADLPWEVYDPVNNAMLWSTSPDGY